MKTRRHAARLSLTAAPPLPPVDDVLVSGPPQAAADVGGITGGHVRFCGTGGGGEVPYSY